MKTNQHLAGKAATPAEGRDGFRSLPVDTEANTPSGVQSFRHRRISRSTEGQNRKNKILIVDDDHRNIKLLAAKLPTKEFDSIFAYGGKRAIEAVRKERPDLILLDVLMPDMDGYEVTRRLKNNPLTRDIPIILLTALNGPEEKTKGLKVGADEFLSKPVHYAELLTRVRSVLSLKEYQKRIKQTTRSHESFKESMIPMESAAKEEDARSILLIESNKKDAGLIQDYLEGLKCKMNWVRDWKEAIYQLNQEKKDLMILSLPLPGSNGLKFCKRLKGLESTKSMQIMVLSSRNDPAISVRTEDYGVDDFMLKPVKKEVFKARINLLLQMNKDSENQVDSLQTSAWETITDKQTGLYERSYFMRQLEIEIKRSLRQKYSLTLIMIHIRLSEMGDDKFGDLTLDQIMKRYGKLVKGCIRDEDLATYFRDKEFAIAMPFLDRNNALSTTRRIQEAIVIHELLPRESAESSALKVSSGIAICPDNASTAGELIEKANAALGKAKKEGDGEICEWEERSTTE